MITGLREEGDGLLGGVGSIEAMVIIKHVLPTGVPGDVGRDETVDSLLDEAKGASYNSKKPGTLLLQVVKAGKTGQNKNHFVGCAASHVRVDGFNTGRYIVTRKVG